MKRNAFELPVVACLYVRMHSFAPEFPSMINKVCIDKNVLLHIFDYFMLNVLEETLVLLFFSVTASSICLIINVLQYLS